MQWTRLKPVSAFQLVGAQYVGELWEQARQESLVFNLLNSFEMTAPVAYLPVAAALPEMLFVGESTANNSSNYATVKTDQTGWL